MSKFAPNNHSSNSHKSTLRDEIKNCILANATSKPLEHSDNCSGGKLPLFERPGIFESNQLRGEILRLATEYVDLLLLQDELRKGASPGTPQQPRPFNMPAYVAKELVTWTVHVLQSLKQFSHELISYADWCDKSTNQFNLSIARSEPELAELGSGKLMASIIKLALISKHKINGILTAQGDIPGEWKRENIQSRLRGLTDPKSDAAKLKACVNDELKNILSAVKSRRLEEKQPQARLARRKS